MSEFTSIPEFIVNKKVNFGTILTILTGIAFAVYFKAIFFIFLFISLDIINSYIDSIYKIALPLDFLMIGAIALSIRYGYAYSLFFVPFIIINKTIMGKFHHRLFIKIPILLGVGYLSFLVKSSPISQTIFLIYLLRYLCEYLYDIVFLKWVDIEKIPQRIYNYIGMTSFFVIFGEILLKLI